MNAIYTFAFGTLGVAIAVVVAVHQRWAGRQRLEPGISEASDGESALQKWFVGGGSVSLACWLAAVSLAETPSGLLFSPPMMNWYIFSTVMMITLAIGFYGFSRFIERRIRARMESGDVVERGREGIRRVIWLAMQGALASIIMYMGGLLAHTH